MGTYFQAPVCLSWHGRMPAVGGQHCQDGNATTQVVAPKPQNRLTPFRDQMGTRSFHLLAGDAEADFASATAGRCGMCSLPPRAQVKSPSPSKRFLVSSK